MARSNPTKRNQREAKHTTLLYGEGYSEKIFLEYLRGIYARSSSVRVTIKCGSGGSPEMIVSKAMRDAGRFDRRIVVMDGDSGAGEMRRVRELAESNGIRIIENTPCLEGVLLSILESGKSYSSMSSGDCKEEFESRYIRRQERRDKRKYEQYFPKALLDEERSRVEELDALISVFEAPK